VSEILGSLFIVGLTGGMVWFALSMSGRAKSNYTRAAVITALLYALFMLPLMYLGAGLVGPVDFATMGPGLAMYGALFAAWYGLWCWFVIRKKTGNG
jgi:hypothetical protein